MSSHDVDALNAGFAGELLEEYLENPSSVPAEWRALFESGDTDLLATQPGLVRLLETLERRGGDGATVAPSDKVSQGDGVRFERGMAVVLQPNPITHDERMGLQLGALTVVRDDGAECLHSIPFEPLLAG